MRNRPLYPLFLKLKKRKCLVVGGGRTGERKVRGLLQAGAHVRVVSPSVTPGLSQLARRRKIELVKGPFARSHLAGVFIAICATDDRKLNARIGAEAKRRGILVNVVDAPDHCDFFPPSTVRRGKFQIAISTGGGAPAVAKRIRSELARRYGKEYGDLIAMISSMRTRIIKEIPHQKRPPVFNAMASPRILRLLSRGERAKARLLMERIVSAKVKKRSDIRK